VTHRPRHAANHSAGPDVLPRGAAPEQSAGRMAMHTSTHRSAGAHDPDTALRDRLTIERLAQAVADLPAVEIVGFDAHWWDGQAYGPCLVVRDTPAGLRRRVLETGGTAVVLPFRRRKASRELALRRAPRRVELSQAPAPRAPLDDLVVDAEGDVVRCPGRRCGAMRSVETTGPCPVCGDS
jgi:hypothetical protein